MTFPAKVLAVRSNIFTGEKKYDLEVRPWLPFGPQNINYVILDVHQDDVTRALRDRKIRFVSKTLAKRKAINLGFCEKGAEMNNDIRRQLASILGSKYAICAFEI